MRLSAGRMDKWDRELVRAYKIVSKVMEESQGIKLTSAGGRYSQVSELHSGSVKACYAVGYVADCVTELRAGEKRRNPKKVKNATGQD